MGVNAKQVCAPTHAVCRLSTSLGHLGRSPSPFHHSKQDKEAFHHSKLDEEAPGMLLFALKALSMTAAAVHDELQPLITARFYRIFRMRGVVGCRFFDVSNFLES